MTRKQLGFAVAAGLALVLLLLWQGYSGTKAEETREALNLAELPDGWEQAYSAGSGLWDWPLVDAANSISWVKGDVRTDCTVLEHTSPAKAAVGFWRLSRMNDQATDRAPADGLCPPSTRCRAWCSSDSNEMKPFCHVLLRTGTRVISMAAGWDTGHLTDDELRSVLLDLEHALAEIDV